jgi:hypothetical protein
MWLSVVVSTFQVDEERQSLCCGLSLFRLVNNMMEFEEYENPVDGDGMDLEAGNDADELMEEDIPVTQEDAWAVIRYALFDFTFAVTGFCTFNADAFPPT